MVSKYWKSINQRGIHLSTIGLQSTPWTGESTIVYFSDIINWTFLYRDIMIHLTELKSSKGLHSRFLIISAKYCFPLYISIAVSLLYHIIIPCIFTILISVLRSISHIPFCVRIFNILHALLFLSALHFIRLTVLITGIPPLSYFSHSSLCSYSISLFWLSTVLSASCFLYSSAYYS